MRRKDLIMLGAASLFILTAFVTLGQHYLGGTKGEAAKKTVVAPVNPNFDTATVDRLSKFFTVKFDLRGLGRSDPFAGI